MTQWTNGMNKIQKFPKQKALNVQHWMEPEDIKWSSADWRSSLLDLLDQSISGAELRRSQLVFFKITIWRRVQSFEKIQIIQLGSQRTFKREVEKYLGKNAKIFKKFSFWRFYAAFL